MHSKKGFLSLITPVRYHMYFGILLTAIGSIFSILGLILISYSLALINDSSFTLWGFDLNFHETFFLSAFIIIFSAIFKKLAFHMTHLAAFKLETILRKNLIQHLSDLPLGDIIDLGTGAIKKVLLDDVKNLHVFMADSIPLLARSVVEPIVILVTLFILNWKLALVSLMLFLLGTIVLFLLMKSSTKHEEISEQSTTDINKAVIEFIQAMTVVRIFDNSKSSFRRYHDSLNIYKDNLKSWIASTSFLSKFSMILFHPMPTILALSALGIYLVSINQLDFFTFISILLISGGIADSLFLVGVASGFIKRSQVCAFRINDFLDMPLMPLINDKQSPSNMDIEYSNLDFKYTAEGKNVLNNINLSIKQGSITAFVGISGAGKSTIAKLLLRFWDTQIGSIKIGGVDIKQIGTETLMDTVSFVFQDNFLFNDTIKNNIKIANENASDEEIIKVAKSAQIHDYIISLPDKYKTKVGDRGTSLSGGQKQRITIARAILRDTPIIVLDEPTSFIDSNNEEKIIASLSNLIKNKTVILIAHNLKTVQDVDNIVVFDKGEIIGMGTHDELIQTNKFYKELFLNTQEAQEWRY